MIDLKSHRLRYALLALLAVPLAACGDSDDRQGDQQEKSETGTATTDTTTTSDRAARESVKDMPDTTQSNADDWAADQIAYLAEYETEDGVLKSPGGVLYTVLEQGDGASPVKGDVVTVHYEGKLIDGTVFDSSYSRGQPATFPSDRLIPGWVEILPMMSVGDKWEIVIPSDLAYGARGAGASIPPNSTLIFTLELLDVADKG